MERKVLVRSLREAAGSSFISERKMRAWVGLGQNKTQDLLQGLEKIQGKYFIEDVADRIQERAVL